METSLSTGVRQPIQAILFDFDGTLAPNLDLPDMRRQVLQLTAKTGVPTEVYADHYIVEVIDAASAWLQRTSSTATAERYYAQAHQLIIDIEMDAATNTHPFPEIPNYLQSLSSSGIATAVVTRNCRAAVLQTFPNILQCVDKVFARDDVTALKPDPKHLTTALAALGQAPESSAMVGDGKLDMHVGRSLGMYCVGVLGGSCERKDLEAAGADLVLNRCADFTLV